MKLALEQLGYGPCYHMSEVIPKPKRVLAWCNIARGRPADWRGLMQGFQATVDFPACVYYRELMDAFPEAKVIHTVRDPERWYQSARETIYEFSGTSPRWLRRLIRPLGHIMDMGNLIIWQGFFEGDFENRQRAIEIFKRHTDNVVRTVPPERLLVFDVKEGWEPLCRFLQVPVPATPFPHVNDTEQFRTMNRRLYRLLHWGPVALVAILLVAVGVLVNGLR